MAASISKTKVGIIGAGPAGLFLAHLLKRAGIDCVILESRSRTYVEARVRAGVLETGTVELMAELGLDARLRRDSMLDESIDIRFGGRMIHIDLQKLAGRSVTIYGQQEVVKDLIAARLDAGDPIVFEAQVTGFDGLTTSQPVIRYRKDGADHELHCEIVAGCDGFHGVSRPAIPGDVMTLYDKEYSFAWFGVMSRSPPISDMTYANNDRGFALCSRRSPQVSRLYVQVPADEDIEQWSDARFWDELHRRMDDPDGTEIVEGEIFQRDVARLRAFVATPMQYGALFIAGDAAHIVPPTGAKGLNLAVADVRVLARGIEDFVRTGSRERLERYSDVALRRVWKTVRYSTYMTGLLHRFPEHSDFDRKLQLSELDTIAGSVAMQTAIAENYAGLPFEDD